MVIQNNLPTLSNLMKQQIVIIDGAMGTAIQMLNLTEKDFGGESYLGCNEHLVLTRPDIIQQIHESYLQAGAHIIETNTFGATPLVLSEYHLEHQTELINYQAARLAKEVTNRYSSPEYPRFVAGSIGPTTRSLALTGGISFSELTEHYVRQIRPLLAGGVDFLLLETVQDALNLKAAVQAIFQIQKQSLSPIPFAISITVERNGRLLSGQTVEAFYASVAHLPLLYLGLNCATGPEDMIPFIEKLHTISHFPIACVPNAGLPDEYGNYKESPEDFTTPLQFMAEKGWLNLAGGCCGTTWKHIQLLTQKLRHLPPRPPQSRSSQSFLSGLDYLPIQNHQRPYIVGERSNVIGSRKFAKLIQKENFEEAVEIALQQVQEGAKIVDICLSNPDRDELQDTRTFYSLLMRRLRTPVMIDSTNPIVIEAALQWIQGKAIINSINLENGLERFEQIVPLALTYGAALVVGCIDENPTEGMARTRERKLAIAQRAYQILTNEFGVHPSDIYFDPLVFPCATGDQTYSQSALETIEGLRLIVQTIPDSKTILGISNVSFGLPSEAREFVNSIFLYHAVQAGLHLAIANPAKIIPYSSIPPEIRILIENLLFRNREEDLQALIHHFRTTSPQPSQESKSNTSISADEILQRAIRYGSKEGLYEALQQKLQEGASPLEIINGPLMKGMEWVGELFAANQLIVAEVLQSAEVMKAAVSYLEPFLQHHESSLLGTMVLATVKGDVHDIGKNLVDIIFSNNGIRVINLGIKVPPETLIEAYHRHHPDLIGLSGLLVKSAYQMVTTAEAFAQAGISVPLLIGGAAISQQFVQTHIAPVYAGPVFYCKDAMAGLDIAKKLLCPDTRDAMIQKSDQPISAPIIISQPSISSSESITRSPAIMLLDKIPQPPDFDLHLDKELPLDEVWQWLNLAMLFTKNLGFRGNFERALQERDPQALKLYRILEDEVKPIYREVTVPQAIYRFFLASSQGNTIFLWDTHHNLLEQFSFPRQPYPPYLCLADYILPEKQNLPQDNLAILVVTAGHGISQAAEQLKHQGRYLYSQMLLALANGTAEAAAEYLHRQIRIAWHIEREELTPQQAFRTQYRGCRYSFGYPACPDLEPQSRIWKLLQPDRYINCQLTSSFMMEPEASVSALVFHHPQAKYFRIAPE